MKLKKADDKKYICEEIYRISTRSHFKSKESPIKYYTYFACMTLYILIESTYINICNAHSKNNYSNTYV